ncbi:CPBP family glutamic-type intramembrane protease [Helicovermis profundi]|uniref:CAAX prenyl protease 2/Lysostaphin resistance protein A-like domain-containing protein n=1 Tax=Helicovermis profundi TaxID=3065157 RepID=A0AAU9EPN2_9FIRM|nr:hypothetical protein HLPR_16470 [Clostridia bacterium S502]
MLLKINRCIFLMPDWIFIIFSVVFSFIIVVLIYPIVTYVFPNIQQSNGSVNLIDSTFFYKIIVGSLIGPLIETLIFQHLVIKFLKKTKYISKNKLLICIISGILFGISHSYDMLYIINITLIDLYLAYVYLLYENKKRNYHLLK